jgi:hypothetical protein
MFASDLPPLRHFRGKILSAGLLIAGLLGLPAGFSPSPAEALSLPEPAGWSCAPVKTIPLRTPALQEIWQERLYRTPSGDPIQALWLEGPGTAGWAPPAAASGDDAPLGFGARYGTLKVGPYDAILEEHPYLGASLSVRLPEGVLTLESKVLSGVALAEAAPALLPR